MSKVLILSLGGVGVAGVGTGALFILKPWESKVVTFSDKYKYALLDTSKHDSFWDSKYTALKTNAGKKHTKLVKAYDEATKQTSPNELEAKRLMREGCKEIYESPVENSEYKDDFKNYCSKTNSEASSTQNWNSENTADSSNNKWDTPLNSLKSHQEGLVDALFQLKTTLSGGTSFNQSHRETIKNWCDGIKKEPFMGTDSLEFKNQERFCKSN
ncbi:hypothetical protein MHC_04015 [Mycoplasma haemocanis str. Illinois]|uniref:Uncharacterized protein n=1 Tax=Mycoplasma haemocanis (strain Illinois) TaxID=1111676 RepID=H6N7N9_MYCHN|nr:hypothetical protein [Mycoplasma haemocanis]AEW45661.2 hypothetical protein MHC_04015 [Mycoplasma haemocanis str. Illinois]